MENTPKSPDAKLNSDPKAAIQAELAAVKSDQADSSWLRQGIDFITQPYHHESAAVQKLEAAAQQVNQQSQSDPARSREIASQAIKQMEASRQSELDAYKIVSGAAKTAVTFTPGKLGYVASGIVYGLDSTGGAGTSTSDAFWGFTKGVFMRGAVSQIARGNESPALMSLKLGLANRVIDTSLTPANFVDKHTGDLTWGSFGHGLVTTGKVSLDPISLGTDVVTAGLAQGVLKIAPKQLAGNTFRAMTTMTFTRGYASGLAEEVQNEYHKGQFSAARLAAYPIAMALSQTLAAAPGNQSLYVRNWPLENALTIRDQDFKLVSLSKTDVNAIARGGGRPIETTVKPIGEDLVAGQPEKLSIGRDNSVPTDWIAAAIKGIKPWGKQAPEEQWRFVSRPKGDENAPWKMVLNKGTTTVPDLIKGNSDYYQGEQTGKFLQNLAEPATKFLGSGSESGAFRLANGTVMKVTSTSRMDEIPQWGKLPYDAKAVFDPIVFGKQTNAYDKNMIYGAHTLLLQEPLKTPVSEGQAAALREQMSEAKISFWDYNYRLQGDQVSWATDQVGIDGTGKPVILDYGARRPFFNWNAAKEKP